MLLWTAQSPFPAGPEISLTLVYAGQKYIIPIRIPLTLCKFGSPLVVDTETFKNLWKQHSTETKFVLTSETAQKTTAEVIREKIATGLRLQIVDGVDRNPANCILAGQFNYMSQSSGQAKSAPMLARIETGQELKVTCHSNSSLVNAGLESIIRFLFDPPKEL
jgi:hypothetical protein